jgi:hypothetical protein
MNQYRQMGYSQQQMDVHEAQFQFLRHAAIAEHYERLKMANADNHDAYYKYAELQYYHKSRAIHYKGRFSAAAFIY